MEKTTIKSATGTVVRVKWEYSNIYRHKTRYSKVQEDYYIVNLPTKLIEAYISGKIPYCLWKKCKYNICVSKVKQIFSHGIGTDIQKTIISIDVVQ